ncbi:MAG: hypothetical protein Q9220_004081 [cf. Caloplaca sp. 1 TL-2023]
MSSGNRGQERSSVADERGNPLVTFRRLVDQQASSLFHSLMDFPTSFTSSVTHPESSSSSVSMEQQRRWREEAEELERSLNDFFAQRRGSKTEDETQQSRENRTMRGSYTPQGMTDRSWGHQQDLADERAKAGEIVACVQDAFSQEPCLDYTERQPLRCPYRPADEDMPESDHSEQMKQVRPAPGWAFQASPPISCLADSPDSALPIEDQDPFHEYGAKWRTAFEELLAMQHGIALPEKQPKDDKASKGDWIPALLQRGLFDKDSFGIGRRRFQAAPEDVATRELESDATESFPTELDVYEHFLGSSSDQSTSRTTSRTISSAAGSQDGASQATVVSTMTTTQRNSLPDGSIHTKVVLKKHFSDGREESTETEHTSNGPQPHSLRTRTLLPQSSEERASKSSPSLGYDGKMKQEIEKKLEEKKTAGWFWS